MNIDVEDDGSVIVSANDAASVESAEAEIAALCEDVKPGTIYDGRVVSTKDFGAFIEIAPGTDGMCHISELADGYVDSVSDVVSVGDEVKVKVLLVDDQGRIKLSIKQADPDYGKRAEPEDEDDDGSPEGGDDSDDDDGDEKPKKKRRRRRRKSKKPEESAASE